MIKSGGTDINLGNLCSKTAYNWAKKTFINREERHGKSIMEADGSFSNILQFGGMRIGITSDGIGTKIELAERTGNYSTLGFDLVAMVADDLAANGLEVTNLSNILDVDYLDQTIVNELMKGLYEAANSARISVTGGEIAELSGRICGFGDKMHFNWCSTAIGVLPTKLARPIDGSSIKKGDKIISLRSRGFRSNGFSLIRKIMTENFGENWHEENYKGKKWGEILLTPSLIYSTHIHKLVNTGLSLSGIVHVTGGGIADNLSRILKGKNFGAKLADIFSPHEEMIKLQELGNISEEQAYRIWNMGNGMLLVVSLENVERVLNNLEIEAKICGEITDNGLIELHTRGLHPQKMFYDI